MNVYSKVIVLLILIFGVSYLIINSYTNSIEIIGNEESNIETFLDDDLTDIQDFELKTTYAKTLYENAFDSDFILGGLVLHTGINNKKDDNRYVLNYYVKNDLFFIIDPRTDKIYDLSEFSETTNFLETYRYVTLFPDVMNMPNYKLTKETREFDRKNPINDREMIKKVNMIHVFDDAEEDIEEIIQDETQFEYPTTFLGLIEHKILYFIAKLEHENVNFEQNIEDYKETSKLKQQCKDKEVYDSYVSSYIAGAKGDIKYLDNNCDAKDVSYSEVIAFVLKDNTDKVKYDYSSFVCADFAEMLHNNAENAGIKCAYVSITANGITEDGISYEGHALNAFNTVDKGLIYIDSTGSMDNMPMDNIATIKSNGIYYRTISRTNYYALTMYMDVENIEVIW